MDAAARWLRDNDPEYIKDRAIQKRKSRQKQRFQKGGNKNRSESRKQMRGVVKENLAGKNIAPKSMKK